jgi:hypothetical protein
MGGSSKTVGDQPGLRNSFEPVSQELLRARYGPEPERWASEQPVDERAAREAKEAASPVASFDPVQFGTALCILPGKNPCEEGNYMSTNAREFVDYWIENGVHAAEQSRAPGASQDVAELTRRCLDMAKGQGITEQAIGDEVGDIAEYIRGNLTAANNAESGRRK